MPRRYKPIKTARLFTKSVGYHEIDWNDWPDVIRRFKQQLHWWYISPLRYLKRRKSHSGFTVVALGCVLIDTLSQYCAGIEQSSGDKFREFVRAKLPSSGGPFSTPIRTWNLHGTEVSAKDFADVLWFGYRCGILHEAHAPLYGRLWGVKGLFEYVASGYTVYADTGLPCPTLNLNPGVFADEVIATFNAYIREIKNPANVALRANFKRKFIVSYGIDIGTEPV
jgi:hypothetical protein